MGLVADTLVAIIALEHLWFLVLEMFLWTRPTGLRVFRQSPEQAKSSAALAANQGLYNGFLAAGLVWGLLASPPFARSIKLFFLGCVLVAGLFGARTVSRRILVVQALPAAIALLLVLASSAVPALAQSPPPSVALPAPLARVLTDYEAAWQGRDPAALAALFAEDGFVLSSGGPPVRGRAGIQRHYTGQGGPLALRALAYATDGSIGYIIGAFARQHDEPDVGKFTLTLRKGAGGRWLIVSDMDNVSSKRP